MRNNLGIMNKIIFLHTGKMSIKERKTEEVIVSFSQTTNQNFILLLVGSLNKKDSKKLLDLIEKDKRIIFLGWKSQEELTQILCASDVYVNIGGMTVTVQSSICCRCFAVLFPHKNYKLLFSDNVFYASNAEELTDRFALINSESLFSLKENCYNNVKDLIDYEKLSKRIEVS